jgi:hypothetical protein
VLILEVDAERRRLSLSLKRVEDGMEVQPRADGGESVHTTPNLDLSSEVFTDEPAADSVDEAVVADEAVSADEAVAADEAVSADEALAADEAISADEAVETGAGNDAGPEPPTASTDEPAEGDPGAVDESLSESQ